MLDLKYYSVYYLFAMIGLLRVTTIAFYWLTASVILLFGVVFAFNTISTKKNSGTLSIYTSKNVFDGYLEYKTQDQFLAYVEGGNSKGALVNKFLSENNSPMTKSSGTFIKAAEKYSLDWRLLPAIAFTESTLGKKTPFGTFNAFGWGVVDNTVKGADFDSWDDAIFKVAKGLRDDYYNQGLTTLESINARYAGDKDWHLKVKNAMSDITN